MLGAECYKICLGLSTEHNIALNTCSTVDSTIGSEDSKFLEACGTE